MDITINYLALVVCAILNMGVGMLWYGPLFGKTWVALMKFDPAKMEEAKKKGMGLSYLWAFLGAFVTAYALVYFIGLLGVSDVMGAIELVCWIVLGFIATTLLSTVLWEGRPFVLYLINVGYYFVVLSLMAFILVSWQ